MSMLDQISYWHWWILAVLLLILETMAPGAVFIWMGAAAAVVGVLLLLVDISWELQLVIFALLSLAAVIGWKHFFAGKALESDQPQLNRRGEQYLGRTFTLTDAITNGTGKITVDDSSWKVTGSDIPAGTTVRVVRVDGVVFEVEPV